MSYKIENRKHAFTASCIKNLLPTPHIHPHLELVYLTSGSAIAVADRNEYELHTGELFLAFPNQIHHYHPKTPVTGYLLIFSPDYFKDLSHIFQNKLPTHSLFSNTQLPADIEAVLERIYTKKATKQLLDETIANGLFLALLGELLSHTELIDKPGEPDSIKKILSYCMEHYTNPLSLDLLAKELYLSKYHISHIFHERMNVSFNDYINFLRVEHSCDILKNGASVTEAAYASGFSTVRTYNSAFKKHIGITPREYIQFHKK